MTEVASAVPSLGGLDHEKIFNALKGEDTKKDMDAAAADVDTKKLEELTERVRQQSEYAKKEAVSADEAPESAALSVGKPQDGHVSAIALEIVTEADANATPAVEAVISSLDDVVPTASEPAIEQAVDVGVPVIEEPSLSEKEIVAEDSAMVEAKEADVQVQTMELAAPTAMNEEPADTSAANEEKKQAIEELMVSQDDAQLEIVTEDASKVKESAKIEDPVKNKEPETTEAEEPAKVEESANHPPEAEVTSTEPALTLSAAAEVETEEEQVKAMAGPTLADEAEPVDATTETDAETAYALAHAHEIDEVEADQPTDAEIAACAMPEADELIAEPQTESKDEAASVLSHIESEPESIDTIPTETTETTPVVPAVSISEDVEPRAEVQASTASSGDTEYPISAEPTPESVDGAAPATESVAETPEEIKEDDTESLAVAIAEEEAEKVNEPAVAEFVVKEMKGESAEPPAAVASEDAQEVAAEIPPAVVVAEESMARPEDASALAAADIPAETAAEPIGEAVPEKDGAVEPSVDDFTENVEAEAAADAPINPVADGTEPEKETVTEAPADVAVEEAHEHSDAVNPTPAAVEAVSDVHEVAAETVESEPSAESASEDAAVDALAPVETATEIPEKSLSAEHTEDVAPTVEEDAKNAELAVEEPIKIVEKADEQPAELATQLDMEPSAVVVEVAEDKPNAAEAPVPEVEIGVGPEFQAVLEYAPAEASTEEVGPSADVVVDNAPPAAETEFVSTPDALEVAEADNTEGQAPVALDSATTEVAKEDATIEKLEAVEIAKERTQAEPVLEEASLEGAKEAEEEVKDVPTEEQDVPAPSVQTEDSTAIDSAAVEIETSLLTNEHKVVLEELAAVAIEKDDVPPATEDAVEISTPVNEVVGTGTEEVQSATAAEEEIKEDIAQDAVPITEEQVCLTELVPVDVPNHQKWDVIETAEHASLVTEDTASFHVEEANINAQNEAEAVRPIDDLPSEEPVPDVQIEMPTPSSEAYSLEEDSEAGDDLLEQRLAEAVGIPVEQILLPSITMLDNPVSSEAEILTPTEAKGEPSAGPADADEAIVASEGQMTGESTESEKPAVEDPEEGDEIAIPDADLSVDTNVTDTLERPKSPWTLSYSVLTQGPGITNVDEVEGESDGEESVDSKLGGAEVTEPAEQAEKEQPLAEAVEIDKVHKGSEGQQVHEDSTEVAILEQPVVEDSEDPEKIAASVARLTVDTNAADMPERPRSPWTPSYSVMMQGTVTQNEPDEIDAEGFVEETSEPKVEVAEPVRQAIPVPENISQAISSEQTSLPAISVPKHSELIPMEADVVEHVGSGEQQPSAETDEADEVVVAAKGQEPEEYSEIVSEQIADEEPEDDVVIAAPVAGLSVDVSVADVPERPKSPWTPSYSVMIQGPGISSEPEAVEDESAMKESSDEHNFGEVEVEESQVAVLEEQEQALEKALITPSHDESLEAVAIDSQFSIPENAPEIERPKSPYPPSYSVTQMGHVDERVEDVSATRNEGSKYVLKAANAPANSLTLQLEAPSPESSASENTERADDVISEVSSNVPEVSMSPRSDLGILTPSFDTRSEVSDASHEPIAPSTPRSDPGASSLAGADTQTPLVVGSQIENDLPLDASVTPIHTPLISAQNKAIDDELEEADIDTLHVSDLATEAANITVDTDHHASTTGPETDVEKVLHADSSLARSEFSSADDLKSDSRTIEVPKENEATDLDAASVPDIQTPVSELVIPRLDISDQAMAIQPVAVAATLSADSADTQISDFSYASQQTGTNVTTPDIETFALTMPKAVGSEGSEVGSIEPLDEDMVTHLSDRNMSVGEFVSRTPTGADGGMKYGVTQTLAMKSFPSAFASDTDHRTGLAQSSVSPVSEDRDVVDQLSLPASRRRLESTTSSLVFPGGWVTSPTHHERPSLEVATGVFSKPKVEVGPVSAAATTVSPVALKEESKWRCVIM